MNEDAKFVRKQLFWKVAIIGVGVTAAIVASGVLTTKEIATLTNSL